MNRMMHPLAVTDFVSKMSALFPLSRFCHSPPVSASFSFSGFGHECRELVPSMAIIKLPPQVQSRPRTSLSVLLLFPPSLLIIIFVLCFPISRLPSNPFREPIAKFSSLLVLKDSDHPLISISNGSCHLSHSLQNSSMPPKSSKRIRRSDPRLRLLSPTARSRSFSARAAKFFNGHSCNHRFFMTWISPSATFGNRELFALESLFKSHPNACLLLVSNTMDTVGGSRLLSPFSESGFRVAAMSPDFPFLFKRTPAELWLQKLRRGLIDPGVFPLGQNLSNLLRLALLYKYGGVYLDTDVIVMRRFSGLRNAIGAQSVDAATGNWSRLNNAVMVFDERHPLVYKFIQEFSCTFDGSKWGHNGPYLVSRVVSRLTGRPDFEFNVLPPSAFYPVNWTEIEGLFRGGGDEVAVNWVDEKLDRIRRRSFALHLWNRKSSGVEVGEGSVIGRLMLDRCLFCNSSRKL